MHLSHTHNEPLKTEMCTSLFWMVHCGIWNRCIVGFVSLANFYTTPPLLLLWHISLQNWNQSPHVHFRVHANDWSLHASQWIKPIYSLIPSDLTNHVWFRGDQTNLYHHMMWPTPHTCQHNCMESWHRASAITHVGTFLYIEAKWLPFCRHFQMHFLEWKFLYFDSNFTELVKFVPKGPNDSKKTSVQFTVCSIGDKQILDPMLTYIYDDRPQWVILPTMKFFEFHAY